MLHCARLVFAPATTTRRGLAGRSRLAVAASGWGQWSTPWMSGQCSSLMRGACCGPGAHAVGGYPMINAPGRGPVSGHSEAHRLYYGDKAPGLHIDHMCGVRRCVNPLHLAAVTQRQNSQHITTNNNPNGFRGVWKTKQGRYIASARPGGVFHSGGTYDTPEEAGAAAERLREELGYYSPKIR